MQQFLKFIFPWHHLVLLLLLPFTLLSPDLAGSQHLSSQIFTEVDGLPSNAIFDITQDLGGEMWFASRGGVARYDGHLWTSYGRQDGLPRNNFRRITIDKTGTVWAATLTTPFAVSFFKDEKWQNLPTRSFEEWGWDLTGFEAHIRDDGTTILACSSATSITIWDGEEWNIMESLGRFSSITAVEWVGEELWIATEDGLRGFDTSTNTYIAEPAPGLPPGAVLGIALAPDGLTVDLLGSHWIATVKHGHVDLITSSLNLNLTKRGSGVNLLRGPAGGWYFGDLEHLYYFHSELGQQNFTLSTGMASIGASSLYLDRENNVWVGSMRGITRICGRCLSSFDQEHGLLSDEVTAVLQVRSGAIILGHGDGLTFLGSPVKTMPFPQLPGISSRVMGLAEGPDGKIWIAADRSGLGYLDQEKNIHWIPNTDFPKQGTFAVLFDRQNRLWIGGSHGLYRKDGDRFVLIPLPDMNPLLSPFVRRLSMDKSGAILVATGMHGVYRVDGDNIDHWSMHGSNGMAQGTFCVFDRPDGGLFIGTNVGLYRIINNKMDKSIAPDPVIDRPIYSITADGLGRIWFGSDVGVLRWDGTKLDQYDVNDGLLGNETNRDALVLTDGGEIWIGTDQGLSIYRPDFDLATPGTPLVSLVEIQVDKEILPADQSLELPSSFLEIVVRFRGVTMRQEKELQFRTWLEPFQDTWQEMRKIPSREMRYTNLSPGTYTFHLQAIRGDGVESDIIHSQTITVLPPLWRTGWFIVIELLIILIVFWSIVSYLSSRRYTSRLKLAVQEKTAKLQASETAVKIESQRLSTTLHSISDGVVTISSKGLIALANPAAMAIMGLPSEEILGAQLDSIFTLNNLENGEAEQATSLTINSPHLLAFTTADGRQMDLEISISPIEGEDFHAGGKVMAFRDITHRRQLEKELLRTQKLESLGVLAGGIAHDFNNLLTIMLGNLALVENSKGINDQERHQLNRMKQATIRSQSLANQLLTFSKGGSPQLKTAYVSDLIPMAVSFALSGSSVEYDINIDPKVSCVKVDAGQFDQVISNLVINASQAMDGQGTVTITANDVPHRPEFPSNGPHVMIEVRDEGCGIPTHNMGQIFDPYFTSKDTGSGLGLATVYSIIIKHGGYLAVESEVDKGASFQIFLPAFPCEQPAEVAPLAQRFSQLQSILILDDEPDVREILSRMLADMGFASIGVADGEKAVASYKKALDSGHPFAAVIADLTIPGGMGGKEAVRKLLELDPGVKAIVVSGYSTGSVMSDFEKYGFKGAIRKPFDQTDLARIIMDLIGKKQ